MFIHGIYLPSVQMKVNAKYIHTYNTHTIALQPPTSLLSVSIHCLNASSIASTCYATLLCLRKKMRLKSAVEADMYRLFQWQRINHNFMVNTLISLNFYSKMFSMKFIPYISIDIKQQIGFFLHCNEMNIDIVVLTPLL